MGTIFLLFGKEKIPPVKRGAARRKSMHSRPSQTAIQVTARPGHSVPRLRSRVPRAARCGGKPGRRYNNMKIPAIASDPYANAYPVFLFIGICMILSPSACIFSHYLLDDSWFHFVTWISKKYEQNFKTFFIRFGRYLLTPAIFLPSTREPFDFSRICGIIAAKRLLYFYFIIIPSAAHGSALGLGRLPAAVV